MIIVGEASSKEIALGLGEFKPCGCAEVSGVWGETLHDEALRPPFPTCMHALLLQVLSVPRLLQGAAALMIKMNCLDSVPSRPG